MFNLFLFLLTAIFFAVTGYHVGFQDGLARAAAMWRKAHDELLKVVRDAQ